MRNGQYLPVGSSCVVLVVSPWLVSVLRSFRRFCGWKRDKDDNNGHISQINVHNVEEIYSFSYNLEYDASIDKYHRNDQLNQQPSNYVDRLGALEQISGIFNA